MAAPVLEWQYGGCYASGCETGWYASPAVADLDGDGHPKVVASAYSVVELDGATGALEWRLRTPGTVVFVPPVEVDEGAKLTVSNAPPE